MDRPSPDVVDERTRVVTAQRRWPVVLVGALIAVAGGVVAVNLVASSGDDPPASAPVATGVLGTVPSADRSAEALRAAQAAEEGPSATSPGLGPAPTSEPTPAPQLVLDDAALPVDLQRYTAPVGLEPFLFRTGDQPGQVVQLAVVARENTAEAGIGYGQIAHVWLAYEGPVDWPPIVDRPEMEIGRPYEAFATADGALYVSVRHRDVSTHLAARIHVADGDVAFAEEVAGLLDFVDAEMDFAAMRVAGLLVAEFDGYDPRAEAAYGRAAEIGDEPVARVVLLPADVEPVGALAGSGGAVNLRFVEDELVIWTSSGPNFTGAALQSPDWVMAVVGDAAPIDLVDLGRQIEVSAQP